MQNVQLRIRVNDQIWSLQGTLSHMVRASKDVKVPYVVFYADHGYIEGPCCPSMKNLTAWSLLWASENEPGLTISAFTQNGARLEIEEDLLVW